MHPRWLISRIFSINGIISVWQAFFRGCADRLRQSSGSFGTQTVLHRSSKLENLVNIWPIYQAHLMT